MSITLSARPAGTTARWPQGRIEIAGGRAGPARDFLEPLLNAFQKGHDCTRASIFSAAAGFAVFDVVGAAFASGAYTFACRKAYRLAYRSQRETPRDRALSSAFVLRRKLGDDGGIGDYVTKPKGMHWRTFERAMERIDRAEDIVDGHTVLLLDRLNRITSR